MNDKRIRISLAEKRKYCDLIKSGANYKTVNLLYKSKHKTELPRRTFYNWTRDKDAKMELEDELEETVDAENAQEEVEKETQNKQDDKKTYTQSKITSFFNK